jgi:Mycobacterium membrane protein
MSDPRRPAGYDPNGPQWAQPTEPPADYHYSGMNPGMSPDVYPAYGNYYSYPSYVPPTTARPTEQLPPYWTQTQYPSPAPPPAEPPPPSPKSRRWLWLAAGGAVVLVIGLVLALVIAHGSSRDDTLVAPLPPMPESSPHVPLPRDETPPAWTPPTIPTPPRRTATATAEPAVPVVPPPAGGIPTTTQPAATENVVYSVTGPGRAISITYVDTGGVLQMEFNVVLPWTREVVLTPSASRAASVTVINVGRDINCSVTLNGTVTRQRTGSGLTICSSLGG